MYLLKRRGGGLVGFVALRFFAEECAFSLSAQAQNRVWDLAESNRRTAQSARRPEGQAASEIFCGHTTIFCLRTRRVLYMTGVLDLDLN